MNQWQNGQAHAMFPQGAAGHLNPSMYGNLAAGQGGNLFDANQFGMLNGGVSQSGTPQPQAFGGPPTFNPGSIVPAKRAHDGMSGSPQQPNPSSRSHTPANPYGGFPNQQQPGASQFANAPTPYQHLQQPPGSNNATPSPTMSNQQFRPPQSQAGQQPQPPRMNNASPSPFPQQGGFGNQMPGTPTPNPQQQQQAHLAQYNQQFNMNPAMMGMPGMAGMPGQMPGQVNSSMPGINNVQRAYQMKLMQQQQQMRTNMMQQRQSAGQPNQMNNFGAPQSQAGQMPNGQAMNAQSMNYKKTQFLQTLNKTALAQGRQFNPAPTVGGKTVDLFVLWNIVASSNGSQQIERRGQWQAVADKMGFPQQQFPMAGEEFKTIWQTYISHYERVWHQMRMSQKQDQARIHAQQMAGLTNAQAQQASPTKMMQPPGSQPNQFPPFQPGQQAQQAPHAAAGPNNASMSPMDGMSTPQHQQPPNQQQLMGPAAGLQPPRRNSSLKRPEPLTPQSAGPARATASPSTAKPQRPPLVKQEAKGAVMKSEEPQSTNYVPMSHPVKYDGGYDVPALNEIGNVLSRAMPTVMSVDDMGVIDTKTITLSLASGIHAEVRCALDALVVISHDTRVALNLEHCEDLLDVIVDCAEEQLDLLSQDAVEVSDALDLPSYEDVLRGSKAEAETLQDVSKFGTHAYDLDRAAEKLIAISTILRNTSFYEFNHKLLTCPSLIKWLSDTIRLLATRNMLLRTYYNTQDFYKDMIIYLSNVTQSLELPTKDDALHILHFLLAFAPQPSPSFTANDGKIRFTSFVPTLHRYLPPAIDCLAKLLARQDPNRTLYRSIFSSSTSSSGDSESPLDLLTRAFALAISVLPDRTKGALGNNTQLRIVEARKAYLTQGMLAADILTTLAPNNDTDLARAWIESEDGWAVSLLNLAALLSVDRNKPQQNPSREQGADMESFRLITYRALTMMKRLAEKAGKGSGVGSHASHLRRTSYVNGNSGALTNGTAATNGTHGPLHQPSRPTDGHTDDDESLTNDNLDDHEESLDLFFSQPRWEGIPQGHAILGALMMHNTDKVALGLLCGLHEMAMQPS